MDLSCLFIALGVEYMVLCMLGNLFTRAGCPQSFHQMFNSTPHRQSRSTDFFYSFGGQFESLRENLVGTSMP